MYDCTFIERSNKNPPISTTFLLRLTASTCHISPRFAYSMIFLIIFFEKINHANRAKHKQIIAF